MSAGHALVDVGRFEEAVRAFCSAATGARAANDARGALAFAYGEVAARLRAHGRAREAIGWLQRAIDVAPASAELHTNLGAAWMEIGKQREARAALQRAIELDPNLGWAHCNLATLLHAAGQWQEALPAYRRAAALLPGFIYPLVHALTLAKDMSQWTHWTEDVEALQRLVPGAENTAPQLDLLYLPLSAQQLKDHAEAHAANLPARVGPTRAAATRSRPPGARLRVGYVSDELRRHATGSLMAEVLELHDRRRFDVHVYAWGRSDGSVVERRVRAAVPALRDISALSNHAAVEHILRDGIDILVDLKGYTQNARTEIFAARPAPVQVNWLGFPGTLGAAFYDYLIADEFIVPPGAERFYTEKIIRLPDTYQPNDRHRPVGTPRSRQAYGLPAEGTVFCCLGKSAKITPDVFADWMAILRAVPGSVLWLLVERADARANLLAEADRRGIDPGRLRLAGPLPFIEHIARFGVADLMLDTFPVGSHTTASEALWAGCPVLARAGDTFTSRVAGSLLRAAGVPELVTSSAADYRELAIALGQDPGCRAALRARLAAARDSCALFDTPRFVRNLEAAYESMCA